MKKSQLRKIIKESIKELITEQSYPGPPCNGTEIHCKVEMCCNMGYSGGCPGNGTHREMCIDGATPQVGQTFKWYNQWGVTFKVLQLNTSPSLSLGAIVSSFQSAPGGWQPHIGLHDSPNCPMTPTSTPCDTSPSTACATQWFQNPNAGWASTWINSKDCTNYTWPAQNLEQQALNIINQAPNQVPGAMGPYNGYQDIWNVANQSGLPTGPPNLKARFTAKMAKAMFAQCQIQNCC